MKRLLQKKNTEQKQEWSPRKGKDYGGEIEYYFNWNKFLSKLLLSDSFTNTLFYVAVSKLT